MKKLLLLLLLCFFSSNAYALFGVDENYQHDADIFRLRHLQYFGELIQEFHAKTGTYPLQGKSKFQNYVYMAAPHQEKYIQGGPPYQHTVTTVETFRKELESGLGRPVDLKFDPQKVPVTAPCFYIYMIMDDTYYFAVHLYNDYSFSKQISNHYNKVEISNVAPNRNGLWNLEQLIQDESFKKTSNEQAYKAGFFIQLEENYK